MRGSHHLAICLSIGALGCGRLDFELRNDAAPADSTGFACPVFAQFCDGFESGDISRWSGSSVATGGTLTVTTSVVHSGLFALEATMPPQQTGAGAKVSYSFPTQTTGRLALREHVFMPEQLSDYDGVIEFSGGLLQYIGLYVEPSLMWAVSEDSNGGGLADYPIAVLAQPGRWYCVELEVVFSPPTVIVYIDDTQVLMTPMADPSPFYNEVSGGMTRASMDGGHAIIDDVVVANQHIGC
ncbi:MAG TPA: hypothetical protein VLB44_10750 [Kofleriaceae bacterium]|nr:hypothetical protein [Kofleriaceae bacterium]